MLIRAYISCRQLPEVVCERMCLNKQQSLIRSLMLFLYFHLSVLELTDRLEIAYVDYRRRVQCSPQWGLPYSRSTCLHASVGCFLQTAHSSNFDWKSDFFFIVKLFVSEFIGLTINIQRKNNAQTTKSLINGTFRADSKPLFDTSRDPFFYILFILWLFGVFAGRRSQICDLCAK